MEHAEARELLLDLACEPAALRRLEQAQSPGAAELRAHLATCAACRADLDAWRGTYDALDAAADGEPAGGDAPARPFTELVASAGRVTPPAGLRDRVLSVARAGAPVPLHPADARRRRLPATAWLAIAAALVVCVGGGAIVIDRTQQLDRARAETAALAGVAVTLDRVLQDPARQVVMLRTAAGAPGGSVSLSASNGSIVILTTALQPPATGQVYRCWITTGGARTAVGEMQLSGSTAYWAGSITSWSYAPAPGSSFTVSLEPIAGGSGTPVLTGTF